MRKTIIALGSLAVLITLVAFTVSDQTSSADQDNQKQESKSVSDNGEKSKQLVIDNLSEAHDSIAATTLNQTFESNGERLNHDMIQDMLKDTKENLNKIVYDGEKEDKLQNAIDLTEKAINQDNPPEPDDRVYLNEIHQIVHELLEHFNGEAEDIEVDITGDPISAEK
ncbi:hypothetical protein [Virgibacillus sp. CBA3643]|uniref:hypothetical protein n=1 Tax=Virgibacillus sp. CBA3643 TaxID=2942278 RepID=UPI0035A28797